MSDSVGVFLLLHWCALIVTHQYMHSLSAGTLLSKGGNLRACPLSIVTQVATRYCGRLGSYRYTNDPVAVCLSPIKSASGSITGSGVFGTMKVS